MENDILIEILNNIKDFRAEEEKRWEENERRWAENEKRWIDNDGKWKQCNGDIFNINEEFKRFYKIMDKNFQALSDKLDNFIKYSNFEHQKLELRLKKIESSQRYFEKVQNVHQELIDIQNIKFSKFMKNCKVS